MGSSSYVTALKNHPKNTERATLKNCPFCGGKARIKTANLFCDTGYRACCSDCSTGTALVIVGQYISYRGEHNKSFTDDEAAQEAARIWNERYEA